MQPQDDENSQFAAQYNSLPQVSDILNFQAEQEAASMNQQNQQFTDAYNSLPSLEEVRQAAGISIDQINPEAYPKGYVQKVKSAERTHEEFQKSPELQFQLLDKLKKSLPEEYSKAKARGEDPDALGMQYDLTPEQELTYHMLSRIVRKPEAAGNDSIQMPDGSFVPNPKNETIRHLPFLRHAINAAESVEAGGVLQRVQKALETNDRAHLQPDDMAKAAQYLEKMKNESEARQGRGFWGNVGAGVAEQAKNTPADFAEFAAMGGLGDTIGQGASKVFGHGVRRALSWLGERAGKGVIEKALQPQGAMSRAISGLAAEIPGAVAQTAMNIPQVAASVAQKLAPEIREFREGDDGKLKLYLEQPGNGVLKGVGDAFIENLSERMGGHMGTAFSAMLPTKVRGFLLMDRIRKEGGVLDKAVKSMETMGFNGAWNEMLEERAGDILRGATGVQPDYGMVQHLMSSDSNIKRQALEQLTTEFISFSALGTFHTAAAATGKPIQQPAAEMPQQPVQPYNSAVQPVGAQPTAGAPQSVSELFMSPAHTVAQGQAQQMGDTRVEGIGDGNGKGYSGNPGVSQQGTSEIPGSRGGSGEENENVDVDGGRGAGVDREGAVSTGDPEIDRIFSLLPGAKVEDLGGGEWKATMPNGLEHRVYRSQHDALVDDPRFDSILDKPENKRSIENEYNGGNVFSPEEWDARKKKMRINAFQQLQFTDGTKATPMSFIALAARKPTSKTAVEETLHGLRALANRVDYNDFHQSSEWQGLVAKYSDPNAHGKRHDQDIAKALMSDAPAKKGMIEAIKNAFRAMFKRLGWDWFDASYGEAHQLDEMVRNAFVQIDRKVGENRGRENSQRVEEDARLVRPEGGLSGVTDGGSSESDSQDGGSIRRGGQGGAEVRGSDLRSQAGKGEAESVPEGPAAGAEQTRVKNPMRKGKVKTIRFYHGGNGGTDGPRWVSQHLDYARGYAMKSGGGSVYYVDIPEGSPLLEKSFDDSGTGQKAPYVNFEAPAEIMAGAKHLEDVKDEQQSNPESDRTDRQEESGSPVRAEENSGSSAGDSNSSAVREDDSPQYTIYPYGTRVAIQLGDKPGFGDEVFSTREEAEKRIEQLKKIEVSNAAYRAKQDAIRAEEEKKQAAIAEEEKPLTDWAEQYSPMQRGKKLAALRKSINAPEEGGVMPLWKFIKMRVEKGYRPEVKDGKKVLRSPDGESYLTQGTITKAGTDFAEHLQKLRDSKNKPSSNEATEKPGAGNGDAVDRIEREAAAIAEAERELKQQAMIYQRDDKIAAAKKNGVPEDSYFDLPFDEWMAIRSKWQESLQPRKEVPGEEEKGQGNEVLKTGEAQPQKSAAELSTRVEQAIQKILKAADAAESRTRLPSGGTSEGSASFDELLRAIGPREVVGQIRSGATPQAAEDAAKKSVRNVIAEHNAKRPGDKTWQRSEKDGDKFIESARNAIESAMGESRVKPIVFADDAEVPSMGSAEAESVIPDNLRERFRAIPTRIRKQIPARKIIVHKKVPDSDARFEHTESDVFYDNQQKVIHILNPNGETAGQELQNEIIAPWAWHFMGDSEFSEWASAIGRPQMKRRGGVGGGFSNVDTFAESVIAWMNGKPWDGTEILFDRMFGKPSLEPSITAKSGQKSLPGMRDAAEELNAREESQREIRKLLEGIDPEYANDLMPYLEKVRDGVLSDRSVDSWGLDLEDSIGDIPEIPEKYETGSLEYINLEKATQQILKDYVDELVKPDTPNLEPQVSEIFGKPLEAKNEKDLDDEVAKRVSAVYDIVFPDGQSRMTLRDWKELSPSEMPDKLKDSIEEFAYRVLKPIQKTIFDFQLAVSRKLDGFTEVEEAKYQEEKDKSTWEGILKSDGPEQQRTALRQQIEAAQKSLKKTRNGSPKNTSLKSEIAIAETRLKAIDDLETKFGKVGEVKAVANPSSKPAKTTAEQEYQKIQSQYPNAIILLRIGDFYEAFNEAAEKLSKSLGLTLTTREKGTSNPTPMVGFPYHSLEGYIQKLVDSGSRVAIADMGGVGNAGGKARGKDLEVRVEGPASPAPTLEQETAAILGRAGEIVKENPATTGPNPDTTYLYHDPIDKIDKRYEWKSGTWYRIQDSGVTKKVLPQSAAQKPWDAGLMKVTKRAEVNLGGEEAKAEVAKPAFVRHSGTAEERAEWAAREAELDAQVEPLEAKRDAKRKKRDAAMKKHDYDKKDKYDAEIDKIDAQIEPLRKESIRLSQLKTLKYREDGYEQAENPATRAYFASKLRDIYRELGIKQDLPEAENAYQTVKKIGEDAAREVGLTGDAASEAGMNLWTTLDSSTSLRLKPLKVIMHDILSGMKRSEAVRKGLQDLDEIAGDVLVGGDRRQIRLAIEQSTYDHEEYQKKIDDALAEARAKVAAEKAISDAANKKLREMQIGSASDYSDEWVGKEPMLAKIIENGDGVFGDSGNGVEMAGSAKIMIDVLVAPKGFVDRVTKSQIADMVGKKAHAGKILKSAKRNASPLNLVYYRKRSDKEFGEWWNAIVTDGKTIGEIDGDFYRYLTSNGLGVSGSPKALAAKMAYVITKGGKPAGIMMGMKSNLDSSLESALAMRKEAEGQSSEASFSLTFDNNKIVSTMRDLEPGADRGALVGAKAIRDKLGLSDEQFVDAAIELAKRGVVSIHRADVPKGYVGHEKDIWTDNLERAGGDGIRGTYVMGLALREPGGSFTPVGQSPDMVDKKQKAIKKALAEMPKAMQRRRRTLEGAKKAALSLIADTQNDMTAFAYSGFGQSKTWKDDFAEAVAKEYLGEGEVEGEASFSLTTLKESLVERAKKFIAKALSNDPPPARELPKDLPKFKNQEAWEAMVKAQGMPQRNWLREQLDKIDNVWKSFTRSSYNIPEGWGEGLFKRDPRWKETAKDNAKFVDAFGQQKTLTQKVRVYENYVLTKIIEPLNGDNRLYSFFQFRNVAAGAHHASIPVDRGGMGQKPFHEEDADIDEVHQAFDDWVKEIDQAIDNMPEADRNALKEAFRRREEERRKLVEEAVAFKVPGFDEKALNNVDYYHQQVLMHLAAIQMQQGKAPGSQTKSGLSPRVKSGMRRKEDLAGERAIWNTQWLEAEAAWRMELAMRIATDAWVESNLSPYAKNREYEIEAQNRNYLAAVGGAENVKKIESIRDLRKRIKKTKGRLTDNLKSEVEDLLGESLDDLVERLKQERDEAAEDAPDDGKKPRSISPKAEALKALRQELLRLDPSQKARERIGRVVANLKKAGFDTDAPEMPARLIDAKNTAHFVVGDDFKRILDLQHSETIAWGKQQPKAAADYHYAIENIIDGLSESQQHIARIGLLAQQWFDAVKSRNNKIARAAKEKTGNVVTAKNILDENPDYREWKISSRSRFHKVVGVFERTVEEFMQRIQDELPLGENSTLADQGEAVKLLIPETGMYLPAHVVDELEGLEEANRTQKPHNLLLLKGKADRVFRTTALLWPTRVIRRELANWATDLPRMLASGDGVEMLSEYGNAKEALALYDKNKLNFHEVGTVGHLLKLAYQDDVIGYGEAATELRGPWSLRDITAYRRLIVAEQSRLQEMMGLVPKMSQAYLDFVKSSERAAELLAMLPENAGMGHLKKFMQSVIKNVPWGERREDTVRFAAFMMFYKKLEKTGGNLDYYYDSNPQLIKGLYEDFGAAKAAARMARDFFGNYRDTSVAARFLRNWVMPFWNWAETVNSRVFWMRYNSFARKGLSNKAKSVVQHLLPMVVQYVWNNLIHRDDEEYVSEYDKTRGHIIIPDVVKHTLAQVFPIDTRNVWLLRNAGLLGDFLGQFGAMEMVDRLMRMGRTKNGTTLKEVLLTPIEAEWEKLVGGLNPMYDATAAIGYALASGSGDGITIPVGNMPARVKPVDDIVSESYGLGNEYATAKALIRPGHAHRKPQEYLGSMFLAISDRMDAALNDAHTYVNRFNKANGEKLKSNILPISEMRDLRYWARRKDQKEFEKARTRWLEENEKHTYLSYRANLAALDPIRRVGAENAKEFLASLNKLETDKLQVARDYQNELMLDMWNMWREAAKKDSPEIRKRLQEQEDTEITSKLSDAAVSPIMVPKQTDHLKAREAGKTIAEYMAEKKAERTAERNAAETWLRDREMLTKPELMQAVVRQQQRGKISIAEQATLMRQINRLK